MIVDVNALNKLKSHFEQRNDGLSLDCLYFFLNYHSLRLKYHDEERISRINAEKRQLMEWLKQYPQVVLYGMGANMLLVKGEVDAAGIQVKAYMDTFQKQSYLKEPSISVERYMLEFSELPILITPTDEEIRWQIRGYLLENGVNDALVRNFITAFDMQPHVPEARELRRRSGRPRYFSLRELSLGSDEVFVDIGACDGQNTVDFFEATNGKGSAIIFEPDRENFMLCSQKFSGNKSVRVLQKGVGNETHSTFIRGGGALAVPSELRKNETDEAIDVVRLDDELRNERVTFLKVGTPFGFETFKGGETLIKEQSPKLATVIGPYHKYERIWEIPELLWELNPNYQLYLRHYSDNFAVTTLFAVSG